MITVWIMQFGFPQDNTDRRYIEIVDGDDTRGYQASRASFKRINELCDRAATQVWASSDIGQWTEVYEF